MKIPFHKPARSSNEFQYLQALLSDIDAIGGVRYTESCCRIIQRLTSSVSCYMTPSGTSALEMAALLCGCRPGDEVIMPSFTFVSTANAFVLRGATAVFADICPDTLNIDPCKVEEAIGPKTRAIVVMHYGGVSCDMDALTEIAKHAGVPLIEDAATAYLAGHKDRMLGSIGDLGCLSFNIKKNVHSAEGGALCVNNPSYDHTAKILEHKGTNRKDFYDGKVDYYEWKAAASHFGMNQITAAFLLSQLEDAEKITEKRLKLWNFYRETLNPLSQRACFDLQHIPSYADHNAHLFCILLPDSVVRTRMMKHLASHGIETAFHYMPLHNSEGGKKYGRFHGEDNFTGKTAKRLLRLPLYDSLSESEASYVSDKISDFFS
jgi:dTDP-4-amino-4,6-dideoxygalactose transaminase